MFFGLARVLATAGGQSQPPAAVGAVRPEEHTFFPSHSARRASFHYGTNDTVPALALRLLGRPGASPTYPVPAGGEHGDETDQLLAEIPIMMMSLCRPGVRDRKMTQPDSDRIRMVTFMFFWLRKVPSLIPMSSYIAPIGTYDCWKPVEGHAAKTRGKTSANAKTSAKGHFGTAPKGIQCSQPVAPKAAVPRSQTATRPRLAFRFLEGGTLITVQFWLQML
jgi:hypothetical protein